MRLYQVHNRAPAMDAIVLESVTKIFRHRPALFNWMGTERTGETRALRDVSLRISAGEVMALLGPNGSGKTTLLKLVSTMLQPDAGQVLVGGANSRTASQRVRRQVGFVVAGERSFFPRLSARENLEFFAAMDDVPRRLRKARINTVLEQTGLQDAGDLLVMKFSAGMYQRLGIARALIKRPAILLLDEPTRSLDPPSAERFWNLALSLAEEGSTIVIATHSFREAAAVADRVAVLHRGELVAAHKISRTSENELRDFYFQSVEEDLAVAAGGWR